MQHCRCASKEKTPVGVRALLLVIPALVLGTGTVFAEKQTFDIEGEFAIPEISGGGDPSEVEIPVSGVTGTITGVSFSIAGSGNCSDADDSAAFGVEHPWVGDLRFVLESPIGTQVVLFDQPNNGGGGANICQLVLDDEALIPFEQSLSSSAPFQGHYSPDGSLSDFDGQDPAGTWKLIISDLTPGDTGTLRRCSLHINTDPGTPAPPPIVGIDTPAGDAETQQNFLEFTGYASNEPGDVEEVTYTVVPVSAKGATTLTGNAVDTSGDGSFSSWSADVPMNNGLNNVFIHAVSSSGARSAFALRRVLSDAELNLPPTLAVNQPSDPDNDRIVQFSSATTEVVFAGTASDPDGSVSSVEFTTDTGANPVYSPVDTFAGNAWTHALSVSPGMNDVSFRAIDNQGRPSEVADWQVIISDINVPPFISATDPDPLAFGSTEVTVTGTASDPDGFVVLVEYRVQMETVVNPPETKYSVPLARFKGTSGEEEENPWLEATSLAPNFAQWSFTTSDFGSDPNMDVSTFYEVRATDNGGAVSGNEEVEIIVKQPTIDPPTVAIIDPAMDIVVDSATGSITVSGTSTSGTNSVEIVQHRVTDLNGTSTYIPATDTSAGNDFSTWEFTRSLSVGSNLIQVRAIDTQDVTSAETEATARTITREQPSNLPPDVVISFPVGNQTVSEQTTSIPFSGAASDPDGNDDIAGVTWQSGPDMDSLGDPQYVRNDTGDWSNWSFDAPLQSFDNYVVVRAFDRLGEFSEDRIRVIERQANDVELLITSPVEGFVALNRENSVDVKGRATIGVEGLSVVQYRVTTETAFDPEPKMEFLPATPRQVTTPWVDANDDIGDFTRWSFTAPLGVGTNTVEVQSLDAQSSQITQIERGIFRRGPGILTDLMVLTDDPTDDFGGDVWGSENVEGFFQVPFQFGPTGFKHDPSAGWLSAAGDFSGNDLTDFIAVTPFGVLFTVGNTGARTVGPAIMRGAGYSVSPDQGRTVLIGDFDGDGFDDAAQINTAGDVLIGWNDGVGGIPAPVLVANAGLMFDPSNGYWLTVGDVNGDGSDDIIQIGPAPANAEVLLSDGSRGFFANEDWGFVSFVWDPDNQAAVHAGDFNGDGLDDLATINNATEAVVSLSTGTSFTPPQVWGTSLGFHDDPNRGLGWWVFALDATGDGVDDLVQLNEFGEAWIAESTGRGSFESPGLNAALGFQHTPDGPWQTVPGWAVP